MRLLKRLLLACLVGLLCLVVLGAIAGGIAWWLLEPRVPSVASLKDVQMQVPLRILSSDGQLIAEYGEMRRNPVQIANVPDSLKHAVLAAEDADFYHHSGIDVVSTFRAAMEVALHHGQKVQGGSTITQQVARNFFLSPQKTYTRKIIEILTSFRIESELSKDQILQLYLNKMFLGHRTYGVAAAAQYYYGKTIDQLSIAQCAAIASSFQSPSVVNPIDHKDRLIARRNWVLGQMLAHRFIDRAQYQQAIATADDAAPHEPPVQVDAPYLAEMVRQQALQKLGSQALTDGYVIRTTIDGHLQALANHALRSRLEDYDHRHGYRGPEAHVALPEPATPAALEQALSSYDDVSGLWPAIITAVNTDAAEAHVQDGQSIKLSVADMKWALGYARKASIGGKGAASILRPGDIIRVREVEDAPTKAAPSAKTKTATVAATDAKHWELEQIPAAQSAMVVLSPDDGAVKALVGGFNFQLSKFNRAVQTARQPGSSFKPFIYSAAFSRGYTPASIINDAPIALPDPSKPGGLWTPQNDDGKFRGPMRLREALAQSVNLVAIRLLDAVGVRYARDYATRFGFPPDAVPPNLSMALGTASVSPMAMARAYAVFANGGFLVTPYYIAEIDNRDGNAIYKADPVQACRNCEARLLDEGKTTAAPTQSDAAAGDPGALGNTANALSTGASTGPLLAPRVIDPRNDFLINSMLQSVVDHGTGAAVKKLGRTDLSGKTGTSNDYHDGWFCGFNGDLVTTVWVGFDDFKSLGHKEFGAQTALPIWMAFMGPALQGKPAAELPMPPGIVTATIDRTTGLPAPPGDTNTTSEMFKIEDLDRLREQAKQQQNQAPVYDIFENEYVRTLLLGSRVQRSPSNPALGFLPRAFSHVRVAIQGNSQSRDLTLCFLYPLFATLHPTRLQGVFAMHKTAGYHRIHAEGRAHQLRRRVALEAARLISEHGIRDYQLAKRKAARHVGVDEDGFLPRNREIEEALREHQRLFRAGEQTQALRTRREAARDVMLFLETFEPRLVGPVLNGTADTHSPVNLHVFDDSPERVATYLLDHGIDFETRAHTFRMDRQRNAEFPVFLFDADGVAVDVTVFPHDALRQAPLDRTDERPQQRASLAALEMMLAEDI